jgi:hypothetical protein
VPRDTRILIEQYGRDAAMDPAPALPEDETAP